MHRPYPTNAYPSLLGLSLFYTPSPSLYTCRLWSVRLSGVFVCCSLVIVFVCLCLSKSIVLQLYVFQLAYSLLNA